MNNNKEQKVKITIENGLAWSLLRKQTKHISCQIFARIHTLPYTSLNPNPNARRGRINSSDTDKKNI